MDAGHQLARTAPIRLTKAATPRVPAVAAFTLLPGSSVGHSQPQPVQIGSLHCFSTWNGASGSHRTSLNAVPSEARAAGQVMVAYASMDSASRAALTNHQRY